MNSQFHKMALYSITVLLGAILIMVAGHQGLSRQAHAWKVEQRV